MSRREAEFTSQAAVNIPIPMAICEAEYKDIFKLNIDALTGPLLSSSIFLQTVKLNACI